MAVPARMNRQRLTVATVGDVFVDHVMTGFGSWPALGQEVFASSYQIEVGGGAAITACALARLGHHVLLLASLGPGNDWVDRRIGEFGPTLAGPRVKERTGVTFSASTSSDRTFFTYYGANRFLHTFLESAEAVDSLAEVRHVHFAMPITHTTAIELFSKLHARGCTVSLDVGWQVEWFENALTGEVLRQTDVFLPNEKEAALLTGRTCVEEMLVRFADAGIPSAVVKLGRRGAAALVEGNPCEVTPPSVEALDSTGAGDAFNAGFIDGFLEGASIRDSIWRGCVCGALSTRKLGALSALPDGEEVLSFL